MVGNVRGPPETLPVWNIMCPVAAEIEDDITRNESPPLKFHSPWNDIIYPYENSKDCQFQGSANHDVPDSNPYRTERLLLFIILSALPIWNGIFDNYKKEHGGRSPDDDVRRTALHFVNFMPRNFFCAEECLKIQWFRFTLQRWVACLKTRSDRRVGATLDTK